MKKITDKGFTFNIAGDRMETVAFQDSIILVYCLKNEKVYPLRYNTKVLPWVK